MKNAGNKSKNRQVAPYQIKVLLHSKGNNRLKREPTGQEKTFANHIFDKGLEFKIYKEFYNSTTKKDKWSSFFNGQMTR